MKPHLLRRKAIVGLLGLVLLAGFWVAQRRVPLGPAAGGPFGSVPMSATTTAAATPAGDWLRVATFNIHGGRGADDRLELGRTAAAMNDFDLIWLNEVHAVGWSGGSQADQLAGRLGLQGLFVPAERRWGRNDFGNALLVDRAVESWTRTPLPATQRRGFRNMLLVRMRLGDQSVRLLLTHLDRRDDGPEQMRLISRTFLALEPPAVLMGDLNRDQDDPQMRQLLNTPGVSDASAGLTQPHIDWILTRGLHISASGQIDNGASDHPLLWAQIQTIAKP